MDHNLLVEFYYILEKIKPFLNEKTNYGFTYKSEYNTLMEEELRDVFTRMLFDPVNYKQLKSINSAQDYLTLVTKDLTSVGYNRSSKHSELLIKLISISKLLKNYSIIKEELKREDLYKYLNFMYYRIETGDKASSNKDIIEEVLSLFDSVYKMGIDKIYKITSSDRSNINDTLDEASTIDDKFIKSELIKISTYKKASKKLNIGL